MRDIILSWVLPHRADTYDSLLATAKNACSGNHDKEYSGGRTTC